MGFTQIGAWIDNNIASAQNTWKGSEAKKTIDDIMERSKKAASEAVDTVSIGASQANENFEQNLDRINKEHSEKGFFGRTLEVGKQGGLVGLMFKKSSCGEENKKVEQKQAEAPVAQQTPGAPQKEQIDGWNLV